MGVFIRVEVDGDRLTPMVSRHLVSTCPVDIFGLDGERLVVRRDEEDECTLCELCLGLAPAGAITIHKLYKEEQLVSRRTDGDSAPGSAENIRDSHI